MTSNGIIEYTPTWVAMLDGWSVVGPFESEEKANEFVSRFGGDAVAMISEDDFMRGISSDPE